LALRYKVVETSSVTEEELERILNEWTARGWRLDAMQFAMRDSSKRPSMAFVTFTRDASESASD
jgi:acetolactate synthase regulatory subunit